MKSVTAVMRQWIVLLCLSGGCAAASAGETHVQITGEAYAIPGILTLPDGAAGASPGVLLLHGTASQKNEVANLYGRLASRLADRGIASLRIDFAGTGDSPVDYRQYNLSSAVSDASQALDYLAQQPSVNGKAMAVLGFSQGGLIAQRLVLQAPEVRALVTWSSTAVDGPGSFQGMFDTYFQEAKQQGYAAISFDWLDKPLHFDRRWFDDMIEQTTLSDMRAYEKPIFAIAGSADNTVSYEQSVALVSQSPNSASQVLVLAGANHIFNVLADGAGAGSSAGILLEATTDWLEELFLRTHDRPH